MEVVETNTNTKTKKTLGRRKIEITKIQKKTSLQVTFSKRRMGLFRKAGELAVLCGAEVAILVQSPAQKMYAFGHPNVGALIDRVNLASYPRMMGMTGGDDGRRKYEEAVERLEIEKRAAAEREAGGCWWEGAIEGMQLQELEELLAGLEGLRENVKGRLEMEEMLRSGELFDKMMEMPPLLSPTEKPVVGGDYASTSSDFRVHSLGI